MDHTIPAHTASASVGMPAGIEARIAALDLGCDTPASTENLYLNARIAALQVGADISDGATTPTPKSRACAAFPDLPEKAPHNLEKPQKSAVSHTFSRSSDPGCSSSRTPCAGYDPGRPPLSVRPFAPQWIDPLPGKHCDTDVALQIQTRKRSIRPIISEGLFYFALAVVVVLIFITSAAGNSPRALFGFVPLTVATNSMQSELPQGSLIIARQVDPDILKIGDNITYLIKGGESVTHQIVGIYENYEGEGQRAFVTKGIENGLADDGVVYADNVVGKVVFCNHALGKAISYARQNTLFVAAIATLSIGFILALRGFIRASKQVGAKSRDDSPALPNRTPAISHTTRSRAPT